MIYESKRLHMILQTYFVTTKEELGICDCTEEDARGSYRPQYIVC